MRFFVIIFLLVIVMPITSSGWAEGSNILLEPHLVCKKPRRLRGKMAEICRNDSELINEIISGINLGFRECEFQFKNRRWNCTTHRKSMKKILMKDTRETAFVNAITAAGVTFAVTRACTTGNLIECSCDKNYPRKNPNKASKKANSLEVPIATEEDGALKIIGKNNPNDRVPKRKNERRPKRKRLGKNIVRPDGDWEWAGCGDNVNFGYRKSKQFLDARYRRRSDIKTLVKLHNNEAGRLAVRDYMRLECKCHGLSGSCTMKTCWLKMPPFREVAIRLKDHFDGAAKVIARNDGNSFMPEEPTIKPPSKEDLVYTDESPDFCRFNHRTGSLGTVGRECNATSQGVDGCDLLCCSRGYDNKIRKVEVNCDCYFQWCCEVICSICVERKKINTCR